MSLKAEIEAIVYATETPVTVEQIAALAKASILAEAAPEPDAEKVVSIDASPIEAAPMTDAVIRGRVRSIIEGKADAQFGRPGIGGWPGLRRPRLGTASATSCARRH